MRKRPNDVEKLDQISQAINSDGKGNLTVGKNLEVDGKFKLNSLVSDNNTEGRAYFPNNDEKIIFYDEINKTTGLPTKIDFNYDNIYNNQHGFLTVAIRTFKNEQEQPIQYFNLMKVVYMHSVELTYQTNKIYTNIITAGYAEGREATTNPQTGCSLTKGHGLKPGSIENACYNNWFLATGSIDGHAIVRIGLLYGNLTAYDAEGNTYNLADYKIRDTASVLRT